MDVRPSQRMRDLGVVQHGAGILTEPVRAFDLPAERDEVEGIMDGLFAAIERISQVHPFAKGMGIAAPQIGIARAAAAVLPPDDAPAVILLNPRITEHSAETDEQYEGCLSFFDVRGLVPRPPHPPRDRPPLYTARMRTGVEPIPVEEYRQTGRAWAYEQALRARPVSPAPIRGQADGCATPAGCADEPPCLRGAASSASGVVVAATWAGCVALRM